MRALAVGFVASIASVSVGALPAWGDRVPPEPPPPAVPTPRQPQQPTQPEPPTEAPPPADAPGGSEPQPPEEPAAPAAPSAPVRPALSPSSGPLDPKTGDYPPLAGAGDRSHDPGLFLRFLLGPAALTAQTGSRSLSGGGIDFGAGVGAAIRRDLIVQVELLFSYAGSPTYKVDGETMDRDFTAAVTALGPGATYYLANNFYVTGAVYASWLRRTETRESPPPPTDPFGDPVVEEVEERSDVGIGASAAVGKEWWITDGWGLGVAVRAYLATVPDAQSADSTWGVHSVSLLVSATMN